MTDRLTFVLNGKRETVDDMPPTTTVLTYLRRHKRLTGSKEGCAEGDCGACTVVVGERIDGQMRYRPVNSCIQFLPMLHGKALVTVDGLAGPDGALHPVQQVIVDRHGSQCGFCTPGFVM
ncbi:MAG: 2Fe-2S iron-sulfur cluster binding domain-containing protein, partial [Hyphomicrobiales bacterium]|nr:2Fe-2S iron-sulfur cluster binding domain-containing protein [Hyphomicrobiales bacterium]